MQILVSEGTRDQFFAYPGLKSWAKFGRPYGPRSGQALRASNPRRARRLGGCLALVRDREKKQVPFGFAQGRLSTWGAPQRGGARRAG